MLRMATGHIHMVALALGQLPCQGSCIHKSTNSCHLKGRGPAEDGKDEVPVWWSVLARGSKGLWAVPDSLPWMRPSKTMRQQPQHLSCSSGTVNAERRRTS